MQRSLNFFQSCKLDTPALLPRSQSSSQICFFGDNKYLLHEISNEISIKYVSGLLCLCWKVVLLDCETLLCSPNSTDTHGYGCVCVSRSFLGGLHSTHSASRGAGRVSKFCFPPHSNSPPPPHLLLPLIQLCWVKRREQL